MGVLIANLWCHNLDLGVIGVERVNQDSIIICCPHNGGVAPFGVGSVVPASALTSTTCVCGVCVGVCGCVCGCVWVCVGVGVGVGVCETG